MLKKKCHLDFKNASDRESRNPHVLQAVPMSHFHGGTQSIPSCSCVAVRSYPPLSFHLCCQLKASGTFAVHIQKIKPLGGYPQRPSCLFGHPVGGSSLSHHWDVLSLLESPSAEMRDCCNLFVSAQYSCIEMLPIVTG